MRTYLHIDEDVRWAEPATLKSGKLFRERYYYGYGTNGVNYRIFKRGGMWEARIDYKQYDSALNDIKENESLHISRTLKEMDDWLGSLAPHKKPNKTGR